MLLVQFERSGSFERRGGGAAKGPKSVFLDFGNFGVFGPIVTYGKVGPKIDFQLTRPEAQKRAETINRALSGNF